MCGQWLKYFYGIFNFFNYLDFYFFGSNCIWLIDIGDYCKVILCFIDFKFDGIGYGDYVKIYDGLEENLYKFLCVLIVFDFYVFFIVVFFFGQIRVYFCVDKVNVVRGFNVIY